MASQYALPQMELAPINPGAGLFRRLRRRKGYFALAFLGTAAVFAVLYVLLPKTYRATASVIVAAHQPLTGKTSEAWAQKIGDPADMESQMLIMESPRLRLALLQEPGIQDALHQDCQAAMSEGGFAAIKRYLTSEKSCDVKLATPSQQLEWLKDRFGIGTSGLSRVIDVNYTSPVPKVAQTMVDGLVGAYLQDARQADSQIRAGAVTWLRNQMQQTGQRLKSLEMEIEKYRRQHGLVNGQFATIGAESLSATAKELAQAQAAQAAAQARLRALNGDPDASNAVLQSRTVSGLKLELAQLDAKLAHLSGSYRDPQIAAAITHERNAVQAMLTKETHDLTVGVQRDYDAATREVTHLRTEMDALEQKVGGDSGAEAAIASLVSDAAVQRELYLDLAKKANDLETERRLATGNAELVSNAALPDKVWFPKTVPFGVAGLIVSLAMGCAAAWMRDSSDHTVRAPVGLEEISGVRVLASIPYASGRQDRQLRVRQGSYGRATPFEESIRALHARLILTKPDERPQVLMLTSSHPGEGKTSTALALARFAASAGRRVLAIECDLRHPSFGESMDVRGKKGLTQYLLHQAELAEIVHQSDTPGLDFVPAGLPSIASTELLSSPRMRALITMGRSYDLVVMDTPPSELLMDARVIAPLADGVIYCARWGATDVGAVVTGMEGIRETGVPVSGLAICMTRRSQSSLYDVSSYYRGRAYPAVQSS